MTFSSFSPFLDLYQALVYLKALPMSMNTATTKVQPEIPVKNLLPKNDVLIFDETSINGILYCFSEEMTYN